MEKKIHKCSPYLLSHAMSVTDFVFALYVQMGIKYENTTYKCYTSMFGFNCITYVGEPLVLISSFFINDTTPMDPPF